jgi:hypothetical protein
MKAVGKQVVKQLLGQIPFTAELYCLLRQHQQPQTRFSLKHLQTEMPGLVEQAAELRKAVHLSRPKKVFLFACLHYWIEHTTLLGLSLAAQGHTVSLGYLPYSDWDKELDRFTLRRQNLYAQRVLSQASPLVETVSFFPSRPSFTRLPDDIMEDLRQVTHYDVQYTLQSEEVDTNSEIYKLRYERNLEIARLAWNFFKVNRPDVVIIPNGTIHEQGVVYRLARHMGIRTVTYEFGDRKQHVWLAQNAEVMRQETDKLWEARGGTPLKEDELEQMRQMFTARQRGALWENFSRAWQGTPAQGGSQARKALGLDDRPLVLLATNVLGDSLTLGRQVFSQSMAEWISRTVQYFNGRPDVQLVIRIHPGEQLTKGPSMVDVVRQVLPRLPEHIHLITPRDKVNTYDMVEVADLGLVYTTTVGMEMAMYGVPVIVSGQTHYRGRGFTLDPDSWVNYFKLLGQVLGKPSSYRLSRQQVETAWEYAYRFFYEYPRPFPWRLVGMWQDYKAHPLAEILGPTGMRVYGATFNYLLGATIDWKTISNGHHHTAHDEIHHTAPVHAEAGETSPGESLPPLPEGGEAPSSSVAEGA